MCLTDNRGSMVRYLTYNRGCTVYGCIFLYRCIYPNAYRVSGVHCTCIKYNHMNIEMKEKHRKCSIKIFENYKRYNLQCAVYIQLYTYTCNTCMPFAVCALKVCNIVFFLLLLWCNRGRGCGCVINTIFHFSIFAVNI